MRFGFFSLALSGLWLAGVTTEQCFEIQNERRVARPNASSVTLKIVSTADTGLFAPLIHSFKVMHPAVVVLYNEVSSTELMRALQAEQATYDIAVSSAIDLQTKLANDSLALAHQSAATRILPD